MEVAGMVLAQFYRERRAEVAEQSRRAEAERAARLELELKLAARNGAKNGGDRLQIA